MPQPLSCLDTEGRQCAEQFRSAFRKPQDEAVVPVLLGLLERFRTERGPVVEAQREPQRQAQSTHRGRPNEPLATGDRMGDASTGRKREPPVTGKARAGQHHWTPHEQRTAWLPGAPSGDPVPQACGVPRVTATFF